MDDPTPPSVNVIEAMSAATLLWSMYRTLGFAEGTDAEDVDLWKKSCKKVRHDWPWLDGLSDHVERDVLGTTILAALQKAAEVEAATWINQDGSAFLSPPS